MNEPKKHHYVPQSILRRFSINNNEKQIYRYDKKNRKILPMSIIDAGSENFFNSFNKDGEKIIFESIFRENDDLVADLLKKIIKSNNLNDITSQDRYNLINIISVQFIRTKIYRTTLSTLSEQLSKSLEKIDKNKNQLPILSENDIRFIAMKSTFDLDPIVKALENKIMLLIQSNYESNFWISDNPVVQYNSFPYGDKGFDSKGVEIYFPISRNLTLGLYCPSLLKKIKTILKFKFITNKYELYFSIVNGIENGFPISIGDQTTTFLNSLQVMSSSRYIFSSDMNFDIADKIIEKNPKYSDINTLFNFGKIGRGTETKKRMPKGIWIVFYTNNDHFLLHVTNLNNNSGFLNFETNDIGVLKAVTQAQPINEVILFNDGNQIRGMKDIKMDIDYRDNFALVIIKHRDDFLNEIISRIKK